jgi:hypothetical protein
VVNRSELFPPVSVPYFRRCTTNINLYRITQGCQGKWGKFLWRKTSPMEVRVKELKKSVVRLAPGCRRFCTAAPSGAWGPCPGRWPRNGRLPPWWGRTKERGQFREETYNIFLHGLPLSFSYTYIVKMLQPATEAVLAVASWTCFYNKCVILKLIHTPNENFEA